jgi:hypothetical protein
MWVSRPLVRSFPNLSRFIGKEPGKVDILEIVVSLLSGGCCELLYLLC